MQGKRESVQAYDNRNFAALENRIIVQGAPGSGQAVWDIRGIAFFSWCFNCDQNLNFSIEASTDFSFGTFDTVLSQTNSPSVLTTPYLLGGNEGLNGYIIISQPFIRLRMVEPDNQTPTFFRFSFKGWY